jgi:hypothetical protein
MLRIYTFWSEFNLVEMNHFSTASKNDPSPESLLISSNHLAEFQRGFIPSPTETEEDFKNRIATCLTWAQKCEMEDLVIAEYKVKLPKSHLIPKEQLFDDAKIIRELYGVCPDWVPAYLDAQQLPALTAGMAVQFLDPSSSHVFTWFQLKPIFRQRKKWLIYSRQEIISHEMCHVCRFPLKSQRYEESLAYKTSSSAFRRKIGGALLAPSDNKLLLFSLFTWSLVDLLALVSITVPNVLFWVMRIFFPSLLTLGLIRNSHIQKELATAEQQLRPIFGQNALSVLFCLDDTQIKNVIACNQQELLAWFCRGDSFQFKFIQSCFPAIYKEDSKE